MKKDSGSAAFLILAAGLGKRMKSSLPKVLHPVNGRAMLAQILETVASSSPGAQVAVVLGHGRSEVEAAIRSCRAFSRLKIHFVTQEKPLGTGHAARAAMESDWGKKQIASGRAISVLPGDAALITNEVIHALAEPLGKSSIRLLTAHHPDPTGYGRVIRSGKGAHASVQKIVEEKDANSREKSIQEVAFSFYVFEPAFFSKALAALKPNNQQGEYYLTDVVAAAVRAKKKVDARLWPSWQDLRGVNDLWELAQVSRELNQRGLRRRCLEGVKILDPETTWIEDSVSIAEGTEIGAGVSIRGESRIGAGCKIKQGSLIEDSTIGARCNVGPYAHLRPGSELASDVKIGNFVELKKSRIGAKTSVAHLSYVGDAEVGERVNVGCGFVTCNFDGRVIDGERKHRTVIEDDVFVGSDCQTVAPVRVGRGAYVASGSTITEDVEPDSLAIARSRQVVKSGYARKLRGS